MKLNANLIAAEAKADNVFDLICSITTQAAVLEKRYQTRTAEMTKEEKIVERLKENSLSLESALGKLTSIDSKLSKDFTIRDLLIELKSDAEKLALLKPSNDSQNIENDVARLIALMYPPSIIK